MFNFIVNKLNISDEKRNKTLKFILKNFSKIKRKITTIEQKVDFLKIILIYIY